MFTKNNLIELLQSVIVSIEKDELSTETQAQLFRSLTSSDFTDDLKKYLILGWYVDSVMNSS